MREAAGGVVLLVACLGIPALAAEPPVKIGRFPQEIARRYTERDGLPSRDVQEVQVDQAGAVWAKTTRGWSVFRGEGWSPASEPARETLRGYVPPERIASLAAGLRQLARMTDGRLVAATRQGLLVETTAEGGRFQDGSFSDGLGRRWAVSDVRGVAVDREGVVWVATPAGVASGRGDQWRFHTARDGLPSADFTCVAVGPDRHVWFGTHRGVCRFDGQDWAYRQGGRWLPHDDVRALVVDDRGQAWMATSEGVGCLGWQPMTLREKAALYEQEIERYVARTTWGYVSEVNFARPGDNQSEVRYHASDNDGLWTSMYGAGECFAYGATKAPEAKARAQRVFRALQFLQEVTQGGSHSPPVGFVARTVLSTDQPDPNEGRQSRDQQTRDEYDRLWKVYEPRWPTSADGKWYWKSDTSSDELDGHYFFYPLYYDLVAETEEEKQAVREVVRLLTDHLLAHDYQLVDHDGQPTRWAIYGPAALNHDPAWWSERGLKSLSLLSYLSVASHITGDDKYQSHVERLITEHAYHTNAMIYKSHRGVGSGNQSDDEMAFMCYYNICKYARDDDLRQRMLLAFLNAWVVEQPELNPFFNFAYAAHGCGARFSDQWGTHALDPWPGWLDASLTTLRGFPLDRWNWPCQNSHRLDIVPLRPQQNVDATDPPRRHAGGLRNGHVLPVENRHFAHWNTDPWRLDYGGDGRQLASGTVFLLPYYMGLYHGFIEELPE